MVCHWGALADLNEFMCSPLHRLWPAAALRGQEGRDVTLPCFTPASLHQPLLHWSFSGGEEPFRILSYDSQSGRSAVPPPWDGHLELDAFRVQFGDGSLRLMDPRGAQHTGSYSCVFAAPRYTHTERTALTVDGPPGGEDPPVETMSAPFARLCQMVQNKSAEPRLSHM